jgi:peptidoglycan hydrolase-like protein with peptidoglycan-binding domain
MNEEEYAQSVCIVQGCLQFISRVHRQIPQAPIDGIYGDSTRQAVYFFQQMAGLSPNGVVDRGTWEKLMQVYDAAEREEREASRIHFFQDKNGIIDQGAVGDAVMVIQIIQNSLRDRVRGLEMVEINGTYGPSEANNTRIIQEIAELPQTGKVDKYTWNEYARIYNVHI